MLKHQLFAILKLGGIAPMYYSSDTLGFTLDRDRAQRFTSRSGVERWLRLLRGKVWKDSPITLEAIEIEAAPLPPPARRTG